MPTYHATIELARAMFGLGHWELIIVLLIIMVVFGAGKLPTVGSSLGQGIRNFRSSLKGERKIAEGQVKAVEPPSKGESEPPQDEEKKE